ncbi:hypothetical protein QBC44DRAFT_130528 [Cladorrhinum sp. PSN332]|nr:hypothetical protein QBC44DRAFT_130528 [Cladorrhinum sp. PSN332]
MSTNDTELNWDEVEAKYWASMQGPRQQNLDQIELDFRNNRMPLQNQITEDLKLVDRLTKEEEELLTRLQQIRDQRKATEEGVKRSTAELRAVFLEHKERKQNFEDGMSAWEAEKKEYFRKCREEQLAKRAANAGLKEGSSSDFALGGPVQAPDVKPLSDKGPRDDGSVAKQAPSQQDTNGHKDQDAQDDVEMSGLNLGDDQLESSSEAAYVDSPQRSSAVLASKGPGATAVPVIPVPTQPAAPAPAPAPALAEASPMPEVNSDSADKALDGAEDQSVGQEKNSVNPGTNSATQLQEPAEISATSTKDLSETSDAPTGDVEMNDVTVVIREKEGATQGVESVEEESIAQTAPDVTMASEPGEAVTPEVRTTEEPVETSKLPRKISLSVVVGQKAPDASMTAGSPQAASPASSLSSLPSSFADLDPPGSPITSLKSVEVLDQNQQVVGQLRSLGKENRSIALITSMPIKRQVQIRTGRNFTVDDLEKVHHPSDQKGAKWISMYIQAVGEIQQHPCDACAKKTGVYQECIMVDSDSFLKCGNCEWNRHACLGAGRPGSRPNSRGDSRPDSRQSTTAKTANRPSTPGGFTPINQSFSTQEGKEADNTSVDGDATPLGIRNSVIAKKPGRTSLPSSRKVASVVTSRPGSPTTPRVGSPAAGSEEAREELPAITAENLCLRDDGDVFTDPPLMRGVPLEKIGPHHPYWDPSWDADIASIISKELKKWTDKFNEMERLQVNDHRKYEAKRQVNRGNTILDWLEKGELHPYQLVGKQWMNAKKLIKYNTLYRLAQMLANELPLYQLSVKPSDWMRHRLNEHLLEEGEEFSLATHVAGFYHDPKVQQVRDQAGFTSVGRPHKASTRKAAGEASTPKGPVGRPLKRKEPPAGESTPRSELTWVQEQQHVVRSSPRKIVVVPSTSSSALGNITNQPAAAGSSSANVPPTPLAADASEDEDEDEEEEDDDDEEIKVHSPAPSRTQLKKKIRLTTNNGSPTVVSTNSFDLSVDGYTSTDSCSNDMLQDIDFRINQVKTPEVSTHPSVTQYWHFVGSSPAMLEHQVLKQLKPAKWAVFRHPYDFHLRYKELSEIVYATSSIRVIIRFKKAKNVPESEGRGDMLAEFKRDRTKRRFLKFMGVKGVKILRSSK